MKLICNLWFDLSNLRPKATSTFRLSFLLTILQDCNQDVVGEGELKQVLIQVAQDLKYSHLLGLAHSDITPGKIFISFRSNVHLKMATSCNIDQ